MKKMTLFSLSIVLLALIAGCAPAAKVYVCADGRQVQSLDMCTSAAPVQEEESILPEPNLESEPVPQLLKDLTPETLELFDKAEKANTVKFNYFRSDNPYTQNVYYASRELLKVELTQKDKYNDNEPFDTVYLNLSSQTAVAYCELASIETCPDRNRKYDVEFEKYRVTTPYEWIGLVSEGSLTGRSKQIDGRQAKEVAFKTASAEGAMWVDAFFGMPLEVNYDGLTYRFDNAIVNIIKEDRLVHQK